MKSFDRTKGPRLNRRQYCWGLRNTHFSECSNVQCSCSFEVFCFLVTSVIRFTLLPYYRPDILKVQDIKKTTFHLLLCYVTCIFFSYYLGRIFSCRRTFHLFFIYPKLIFVFLLSGSNNTKFSEVFSFLKFECYQINKISLNLSDHS